jgi:hypothetical protein
MIINDLERAKTLIESSIKGLNENPDKVLIKELIDACRAIEFKYKAMCNSIDENSGDPKGSNYDEGPSIEFEIEADDWHPISKCLRKLFPNESFSVEEDE